MTPERGEGLDAGRRDRHQVVRREARPGRRRARRRRSRRTRRRGGGERGHGGRRPRAPGATPRRRTPPPRRRRRRSGRARPRRWPARSRRRSGRPSAAAPAVACPILGRHLVGGEQGRHQVHRMPAGGLADGAELLELVLLVEAVAALRLGGGGAPGEHLVHPPQDVGDQLLLARPAGGGHGREDAAAGRRDLLVGLARQPRRELLLAAAGPGEMGVGIDETRDQRAPAAVEPLGVRQARRAGAAAPRESPRRRSGRRGRPPPRSAIRRTRRCSGSAQGLRALRRWRPRRGCG